MEATLTQIHSTLTVITDPVQVKAGEAGTLTINGKPTLTVNKPLASIAAQVYTEFSKRLSVTGHPFKLSINLRGIVTLDAWNRLSRVTAKEMEHIILDWYQPVSKFSGIGGAPALMLVDKLPKYLTIQLQQGRYFTEELMGPFELADVKVISKPFNLKLGPKRS